MRQPSRRWVAEAARLPVQAGNWSYSRAPRADDPPQGWKLHVAATILSASDVFARARAVLRKYDALFKLPARFEVLQSLNAGIVDYSQVGKFLTVYPRNTPEAVKIARELHAATRGLAGPRVPSDLRYRNGSLVHYRYGSFRNSRPVIFDVAGKAHPDRRTPGKAVPPWLENPFRTGGREKKRSLLIGGHYLPFAAKAQRGKGGVYEALDLSVSPPRKVMIKEGRRHGETGLDGQDGFSRIRHEGRVLRALSRAGVGVPELLGEFTQGGNRYLALEKLPGRALSASIGTKRAKPSERTVARTIEELARQLRLMHAAGWVWRDCKPAHVIVHRGRMRLIDFEGACGISDKRVLPWGSVDYVPPAIVGRFTRKAGTAEDDYALGVVGYELATGVLPPASLKQRSRLLRRAKCPHELRGLIEQLLSTPT